MDALTNSSCDTTVDGKCDAGNITGLVRSEKDGCTSHVPSGPHFSKQWNRTIAFFAYDVPLDTSFSLTTLDGNGRIHKARHDCVDPNSVRSVVNRH